MKFLCKFKHFQTFSSTLWTPLKCFLLMRLHPRTAPQTSWLELAATSCRRGEGRTRRGQEKREGSKRRANEGKEKGIGTRKGDCLWPPWYAVVPQAMLAGYEPVFSSAENVNNSKKWAVTQKSDHAEMLVFLYEKSTCHRLTVDKEPSE